jgi:hypothetical protein
MGRCTVHRRNIRPVSVSFRSYTFFIPELRTHLESRDDVALDGVSDGRLDLIQREVAPEGVQCHCTADDSRVIAHGKGGHRGH